MDKSAFHLAVSNNLFNGGALTPEQIVGIDAILKAFNEWGTGDVRHLAYNLATGHHETGGRFAPLREGQQQRKVWTDAQARRAVELLWKRGKISRNYALPGTNGQSYYGRGLAQITHEENYRRIGNIIKVDLVKDPDRALELGIAARILVEGSLKGISRKGDFTRFSLEDFIAGSKCDYVGARQVINGKDCAQQIADLAVKYERSLTTAGFPHKVYKPETSKETPVQRVAVKKAEPPLPPVLMGIQKRLAELGYHEVGKPDGLWGTKTQSAVLAFRADNGLKLLTEVDQEFMVTLWTAAPRLIGEDRANATFEEVKKYVPGATEIGWLKKAAGIIGLGGLVTGGTLTADDIVGVTERVRALKELATALPDPSILLVGGGTSLVGYWLITRVGLKLLSAYQSGKV